MKYPTKIGLMLTSALLLVASAAAHAATWELRYDAIGSGGPGAPGAAGFERGAGFLIGTEDDVWVYDDVANTITGTGSWVQDFDFFNGSVFLDVFQHDVTDVLIDLDTGVATVGSFGCTNGPFPPGRDVCAGYFYGTDGVDDSTTNPDGSLDTLDGDDELDPGGGQDAQKVFGHDNLTVIGGGPLTIGSMLTLDKGAEYDGTMPGNFQLKFTVVPVPAAVWLFGSALGGLGLFGRLRRRAVA